MPRTKHDESEEDEDESPQPATAPTIKTEDKSCFNVTSKRGKSRSLRERWNCAKGGGSVLKPGTYWPLFNSALVRLSAPAPQWPAAEHERG